MGSITSLPQLVPYSYPHPATWFAASIQLKRLLSSLLISLFVFDPNKTLAADFVYSTDLPNFLCKSTSPNFPRKIKTKFALL